MVDVERDGAAGVRKAAGTGRGRLVRLSPGRARSARGAVLGRFQMADEVVVLERSGRQEEDMEHESQQRHAPQPPLSQAAKHVLR